MPLATLLSSITSLLVHTSLPPPLRARKGMMTRTTRRASATSVSAAVSAARTARTAAGGAAETAAGSAARNAAETGSGPGERVAVCVCGGGAGVCHTGLKSV